MPAIKSLLHNVRALTVPDSVRIFEVGPRDGLQNEKKIISLNEKVLLIKKLVEAGCTNIEVGSFVSSKAVPAMANTFDLMRTLQNDLDKGNDKPASKVVFSCLVPNVKYLQSALEVNVKEIAIFGSASETFSRKVRA